MSKFTTLDGNRDTPTNRDYMLGEDTGPVPPDMFKGMKYEIKCTQCGFIAGHVPEELLEGDMYDNTMGAITAALELHEIRCNK